MKLMMIIIRMVLISSAIFLVMCYNEIRNRECRYEEKMEFAIRYDLLCLGCFFYNLYRWMGDADSADTSAFDRIYS